MAGEGKPGIEAAKWLAFFLMVADHVNLYLLGFEYPVVYLLGRLVFPLFALALAEGLAQGGELRANDTLRRLVVWGCIAQVPWMSFKHEAVLNVLFDLAAGLAGYLAVFGSRALAVRAACLASGVLVAVLGEFGVAGFFTVLGALWWRERRDVPGLVAFCVGLTTLYVPNGTWFGLAALPAWWGLQYVGTLPRGRHWFYYFYPGHLVVLAFARWAL